MKNVKYLVAIAAFATLAFVGFSAFTSTSVNPTPAMPKAVASTLNLKLFIEGYYVVGNGLMKPVLKNQGQGSNDAVTDNITVELHNASSPYGIVATATAVLNTDGTATCSFEPAVNGSYYIVVKHRSAVTTWSASPVAIGTAATTYDFTTAATQAHGSNMAEVESGKWAFFNGDVNQDGWVNLNDVLEVYNGSAAFHTGYKTTDLNGDGAVDLSDIIIANNNSTNFVEAKQP
ncbi:MAG: dockerin type I domain-containing protein [Saprospiraceae bacterium]